jgi:hypothetical protein
MAHLCFCEMSWCMRTHARTHARKYALDKRTCVCLCVGHHHVPVPMQSSDSKTRRPVGVLQHHELLPSSPVTHEHLYYVHVPALGRVVKAAPILGIAFHSKRPPPPLQQHPDHLWSNVGCCKRESIRVNPGLCYTRTHAHTDTHAHTHAHTRTQQAPHHGP